MYTIQARYHPLCTWLSSRLFKICVQLLYHYPVNKSKDFLL
nr:MAG TPA: hypothetical protein [Caudoviricetes sp.]